VQIVSMSYVSVFVFPFVVVTMVGRAFFGLMMTGRMLWFPGKIILFHKEFGLYGLDEFAIVAV
jgi:hypothetical protein